ncbi:MAG: complex I subunit 5 family protein [Archaeoglobaceae archaeon]|nr:complex I subunit 5 family protein [Archaeoglobaceae archaeon]MDW8118557.1 complex I subunit 5 family protein [Archaeoglobaceae archaeon]
MSLFLYILLFPLLITFILPIFRPRIATALSAISFLFPAIASLCLLLVAHRGEELLMNLPAPIGDFYLLYDPISHAFGFTISLVSAMVALYSLPYMKHRFEEMELKKAEEFRKYWFLYNLYAVSMLWLVYSGNLLLLYIFLEISLLTSFMLIYLYGYGNRHWVGILYFVWTHIAGVLALTGFLMVAFANQSLALNELRTIGFIPWLLIFLGMVVKLPGLGPHIWLPWAHAEAPTPVSALLSPLTVGLAGYILLRIYLIDNSFVVEFRDLIIIYAILSSIYAGLSVFKQRDYKRLLAYSTVSQMGYVLIALCLGSYGLIALVIQYMSHAFGKAILFMTAGAIITTFHGLRSLDKMKGMHEFIPTISNAALVGFMTLSGIITIGMLAEFFILLGLVKVYEFDLAMISLVVFVFVISGLYSFYTMREIYYGTPIGYEKPKFSRLLDLPLYAIAFFSVAFIFPPLAPALLEGIKLVLGGVMP